MTTWKKWFRDARPDIAKEGAEVYGEIKEALRRQQIDGAGSDAFDKRARAAADLLRALEGVPNAMVRLGDVVVAKATINGNARIAIETMSPLLARQLEQSPLISSDPVRFFALLDDSFDKRDEPGEQPAQDVRTGRRIRPTE